MNNYLIICMCLVSNYILAQDFTMMCKGKELPFEHGGKENFRMVVLCPYKEYDSDNNMPLNISIQNRNYLYSKLGNSSLLEKIKLESCYIIDFFNPEIKRPNGWIENADKRVKYAYHYSLNITNNMKYYFTTVYDSLGNFIAQSQLPNYNTNKHFDKILSPCQAKCIAEKDSLFKGVVQNISFQYLDSTNSFVWKVQMPNVKTMHSDVFFERYILLDANNGQSVKRYIQKLYSSCDGNTPQYPKLKLNKKSRE